MLEGRACASSKKLNTTQPQCAAILPHLLPPSHVSCSTSLHCSIPPHHCTLIYQSGTANCCVSHSIFFCPNSFTCKYLLQCVIGLVQNFWFLKHLDILILPRVRVSGGKIHRVPKSLSTTLLASNRKHHSTELSSPRGLSSVNCSSINSSSTLWASPLVLAWPYSETIVSFL